MLARRLTTILLIMTVAEALETTRIHRVAGLTGARTTLVTTRPCRAPPQTVSDGGLIGDEDLPMHGEVSGAHHGIFFGDELSGQVLHSRRAEIGLGKLVATAYSGNSLGVTSGVSSCTDYHRALGQQTEEEATWGRREWFS